MFRPKRPKLPNPIEPKDVTEPQPEQAEERSGDSRNDGVEREKENVIDGLHGMIALVQAAGALDLVTLREELLVGFPLLMSPPPSPAPEDGGQKQSGQEKADPPNAAGQELMDPIIACSIARFHDDGFHTFRALAGYFRTGMISTRRSFFQT
jgi:hypothetical protein